MTDSVSDKLVEEVVRRVLAEMKDAAPAPAPAAPKPERIRPEVLTGTIGLMVYRPDAKVEAALASAARGGVVFRGYSESTCEITNALAMCKAVSAGDVAGGVLLDRHAAAGVALAGKVRGIRPVQGVSVAAVLAGLRQFNANVLVIGHAQASVYEIRTMIDRFASARRMGRDRTALLDTIEQLEADST